MVAFTLVDEVLCMEAAHILEDSRFKLRYDNVIQHDNERRLMHLVSSTSLQRAMDPCAGKDERLLKIPCMGESSVDKMKCIWNFK